jgi:hypothetical protein
MAILLLEALAVWCGLAVALGFALGAAIKRADRVRKDAFLTCVFATIETLQASQS